MSLSTISALNSYINTFKRQFLNHKNGKMIIVSLTPSPLNQACTGNTIKNFVNIKFKENKVIASVITVSLYAF